MIRLLFLLFVLPFLTSCTNQSIKKELIRLQSEPIKLPTNAAITIHGRDTTIMDLYKADLKMVVYIDSIACASCQISHMPFWNPLIEYADSLNNRLKYYFVFSPRKEDRKAVRVSLGLYPIDYPVLIDDNGEFARLNRHIPQNRALHTFLLNNENQVVLVGSPVENQQVKTLFYKITKELLTSCKTNK